MFHVYIKEKQKDSLTMTVADVKIGCLLACDTGIRI